MFKRIGKTVTQLPLIAIVVGIQRQHLQGTALLIWNGSIVIFRCSRGILQESIFLRGRVVADLKTGLAYVLCILPLLYLVTELYDRGRRAQRSLPTRGLNSLILSYINGVMNCFDGRDSVRRACLKLGKWFVLARSSSHIHDLCNAPEDILSMEEAAEEVIPDLI
ncbi:cytochrome p450 [Moniliophthora roreri]|nr:cytochrome p450 [Moniliophthora roreri]